ncbi:MULTISPECIES: phosphoglucosamine mutase [Abiotrophia]|jgi:phosphoglucosamine mutase|uniref:Phosphoglucosamine mutase n=1 Tax=Abiotrophia defectiva TaxID=46125 RepID=A0A929MNF9_ABIDE|nr:MULTISPECIES: phosphoglucosamine mutase [Abiotrophia]MBF0934337.1 phosphoglucosamine mutase [Abiotrophia defectiva]MBF0941062.1 phosphoglucosamine mutase [Abiotrophia sp.]MCY7224306.1 phosphoglucosamine mutase [Abiotrophia defectiva]OFS28695.1 phosphoglucosamine mutase [Abiotrophia sp. HMSC24B09]
MGKYFGTDGVRGVANTELTPELAFKLGRCGGYVLMQHAPEQAHPRVLVARDTRISGQLLEQALVAGLLSVGIEVMQLGVISTPAVAYLTRTQNAAAGVMISASHNPALDNGIKFFGSDGFKLSDQQEEEIEALIDAPEDTLPRPSTDGLGTIDEFPEGAIKYLQFLQSTISGDLEGIRVCIDAANGATAPLVNQLFADLETDFYTMGDRPNGININDGVGSTHPEGLQAFVKEKGAMVGLAFDGDGDRLIAVDENGELVDGDKIMFICGQHLKSKGRLEKDTIVSTVMSNIGFHKAIEEHGMVALKAQVGDRYVVEAMREGGYVLGGEQSGHIVFLNLNTTGDGLLSAVQLLAVMKETGKSLSELAAQVTIFPQKLVNIRVRDKHTVMDEPAVKAVIEAVEAEMNGDGRILVRPSGTEPLLRVMAEASTDEKVSRYVDTIADVIRAERGIE